jgi:hypothetical protein
LRRPKNVVPFLLEPLVTVAPVRHQQPRCVQVAQFRLLHYLWRGQG